MALRAWRPDRADRGRAPRDEAMLDRIAKGLFVAGLAALPVLAGLAIGRYRLPPAPQLNAGVDALQDWRMNWKSYLGREPTKFLRKARYPGAGVVVNEPGLAQPGVTFMAGLWDSLPGLTLRALDGTELHRWPARFGAIWPDPSHLRPDEIPFNDLDAHIHGALLYPNGDVVFNFEYRGAVRLDRCGKVLWRLPRRAHHSVWPDDAGNLWIPSVKAQHDAPDSRFPRLVPPFVEDSILQVSPDDGRILREISILDVLHGSTYEGALLPNGQKRVELESEDPTHLNHVEPLSAAMAPAFPMFAAGDLLVSLRELNLVMVVDGRAERVKWSRTGPWVRQHEPHFLPDGRISVFDNRNTENPDHAARGKPRFASRPLAVDPATGRTDVVHEGTLQQPFFTDIMGKEQRLANGNVLVTEATAGRAFEVTPSGRIAWSFVNRFDADRVALLEQATRYPESYAAFAARPCPKG